MTTSSETQLTVVATAQSLAAEAASLQARICELRDTLALLDLQKQLLSDALQRLRAVGTEPAPASPPATPGS